MGINYFDGSADAIIQAGVVCGGIHIKTPRRQPVKPIAAGAEVVERTNVTVQGSDGKWVKIPRSECIQIVVQRLDGAEVVISRPRLNVVSRQPARPCYTPAPGPSRSEISLHQMWIADISLDNPRVEPDIGPARFQFDLTDGKAESFLIYIDGLIDPEEEIFVEQECVFWLEVEWMCEGRRGVVDVGDSEGWPFFWHPLRPSLGVQSG
jgi:hypothetical protein